ncbi:uncharacterized protein [Asterias amurensis]|uniref:uncharacterized protein n=1 Tax=Asterias amurensis TaxID=7602 RepID=UPI003AB2F057
MHRLILGLAVLIGCISLVPKSAEASCPSGLTEFQCHQLRQSGSSFSRSLDESTELRNLNLNELDDDTLKRALDMLLAEKAMEEFEVEETETTEMRKRLEEEKQLRSQYERVRELLNKLLQE